MSADRTSPGNKIYVNDVELDPLLQSDVLEVNVTQHADGADMFTITFNILDPANQRLKWIDGQEFTPGNKVEIKAGYAGSLSSLIIGEITALRMLCPGDEAATLTVQGFDRLHRLRRGRQTRVYSEMKDSQIAEKIARELNLEPDVEDTGIVHHYVIQNNLSDIDFLLQRARRIRYEAIVSDQTLIFRAAASHKGSVATLEYMKDVLSFTARLSTADQAAELAVRGWNPATKEAILGKAGSADISALMQGSSAGPEIAQAGFGDSTITVVDTPVASQAEADQIAKARFNDMAIRLIDGEVRLAGNESLQAGTTVEIKGLAGRFSGLYYVTKAEHRLNPKEGYNTTLQISRSAS
jgi:phage protein D